MKEISYDLAYYCPEKEEVDQHGTYFDKAVHRRALVVEVVKLHIKLEFNFEAIPVVFIHWFSILVPIWEVLA